MRGLNQQEGVYSDSFAEQRVAGLLSPLLEGTLSSLQDAVLSGMDTTEELEGEESLLASKSQQKGLRTGFESASELLGPTTE